MWVTTRHRSWTRHQEILSRLEIRFAVLLVSIGSLLRAFWEDRRGNVAIITAVAMLPLVGSTAAGIEVGYWYYRQQAMQNAADVAAVAAATEGGASYVQEARGVAAQYGFTHNPTKNIFVDVTKDAPCPSGESDCYKVTIKSYVPLMLSQVVGYNGTTTITSTVNGNTVQSRQTELRTSAIAETVGTKRKYCVLALGVDGAKWDIEFNGAPKTDIKNCGIMSNDTMNCNGHKVAPYADSPKGDTGPCGVEVGRPPASKLPDPYAHLAENIPPNPCNAGYSTPYKPATTVEGYTLWCGDLKLSDTGLTSNYRTLSNTTLVIYGGKLDTNEQNFTGTNVAVVFSGATNSGTSHILMDNKNGSKAVVNIKAPTSGPWSGVALYQDPELVTGVDITEAGSKPVWNISGLLYLPKAHLLISGAIGKFSSGASCLVIVVDSLRVNGTGSFISNSDECDDAGLKTPSMQRGKLVV